ncbi:hypothetical protein [Streptomyces sp. NPDC054783]
MPDPVADVPTTATRLRRWTARSERLRRTTRWLLTAPATWRDVLWT